THGQRRVEDAIGGDVIAVGEREELLADVVAILEVEVAHAAHLIRRLAILDVRLAYRRVPGRVAVEVAQHFPDALDRRLDDCGTFDSDHEPSQKEMGSDPIYWKKGSDP